MQHMDGKTSRAVVLPPLSCNLSDSGKLSLDRSPPKSTSADSFVMQHCLRHLSESIRSKDYLTCATVALLLADASSQFYGVVAEEGLRRDAVSV